MGCYLPTKAQKEWLKLGYGLFIHYGPNTLEGVAWGDGSFSVEQFKVGNLDLNQWADFAAQAGMKYAILTVKHHDGFCLWPTEFTGYSVKNAPDKRDIVREFVEAFRRVGIKTGFYYSLWDRNYSNYDNDELCVEYIKNQLGELLTNYGEVLQIWFDGAWDKDNPTREWPFNSDWIKDAESGLLHGERWHWEEIYNYIHKIQPNCLISSNSSSDRGGVVLYQPMDIATCEHFNFIWKGKLYPTDLKTNYIDDKGDKHFIPLEYCTTTTPGWFNKFDASWSHPTGAAIAEWYKIARKNNANFLINIGPNSDGLISDYHKQFFYEARNIINSFEPDHI